MILVTGGGGFIGSNLVSALNQRGHSEILLVEDLSDGHKILNLSDCRIADYLDKDLCLNRLEADIKFDAPIECVFHLGACSDTTEWNGRYMMEANFRFSRALFDYCAKHAIPFVYASSAAVYGSSSKFSEIAENERPLNVYGYSKLTFDQYVRYRLPRIDSLAIGLRYFNVYGPREQHKGRMASVIWHFHRQLEERGVVRLFDASHGYLAGEQQRDFIHVDDAVSVTLWCAEQRPAASGIYNCGTGRAESFNAVGTAIVDWYGRGSIEYIEFPHELDAAYQAYTQADLARLRSIGYSGAFKNVSAGVREYLSWLAGS